MKKNTQKFTKSFWRSSFLAIAYLFSLSINAQDLILQGIIDFDIPSAGNDGKAIHVLALNNIDDLSLYGIGVANNGEGTDGQEYTFPPVSASAGDNILVARSPSNIALYLAANEDNIMLANTNIGQNGDDAIELFYNGQVIETFGDINNDGTDQSWEYLDSWAYKENGVWTYGGVACTVDSETSATSECPYPYTGVYVNNVETFDVTFSVNTANITVEENGIFLGGGVLGGSDEYAMADDDGDGTWTVTISLNEGTQGNYTFFNGPISSSDWGSGENLTGQECADPDNYYDRILEPITADTTLLHCFNSCGTDGTCPSEFYNITFNVNTANIEVGQNGMFVGGGFVADILGGGANALPMTDEDGDGIWTASMEVLSGTAGGYTYVNSTSNYDGKEDISGQDCADSDNWNDRVLDGPVTEDITFNHCYGSCETDGTCPSPATPTAVTFNVDMNDYGSEFTTVHVNGEFTNWCGSCGNVMTDEDGDGVYTLTMDINPGTYFWKFSVDGWEDQESFSEVIEGCTAENNNFFDRQIVIGDEALTASWVWNTCNALSTIEAPVLDMRIYPNPSNGDYITIQTPVNGVKYVEIFDITGKRLINTSLSTDTLDISTMSSGLYLVKVTIEGQSKTSKLIIR
jgi:hypothetical protein